MGLKSSLHPNEDTVFRGVLGSLKRCSLIGERTADLLEEVTGYTRPNRRLSITIGVGIGIPVIVTSDDIEDVWNPRNQREKGGVSLDLQ